MKKFTATGPDLEHSACSRWPVSLAAGPGLCGSCELLAQLAWRKVKFVGLEVSAATPHKYSQSPTLNIVVGPHVSTGSCLTVGICGAYVFGAQFAFHPILLNNRDSLLPRAVEEKC